MAADRTANDREQPANAEMIKQPTLDGYHISNRDRREISAISAARFRIDAAGPGAPATTSKQVRTNDEEAVRIDWLCRTHHDIPPSRIVRQIVPRHVGITADRVANQDDVVPGRVELSVSFIGHGNTGQFPAQFQAEQIVERDALQIAKRAGMSNSIGALKGLSSPWLWERFPG